MSIHGCGEEVSSLKVQMDILLSSSTRAPCIKNLVKIEELRYDCVL